MKTGLPLVMYWETRSAVSPQMMMLNHSVWSSHSFVVWFRRRLFTARPHPH